MLREKGPLAGESGARRGVQGRRAGESDRGYGRPPQESCHEGGQDGQQGGQRHPLPDSKPIGDGLALTIRDEEDVAFGLVGGLAVPMRLLDWVHVEARGLGEEKVAVGREPLGEVVVHRWSGQSVGQSRQRHQEQVLATGSAGGGP